MDAQTPSGTKAMALDSEDLKGAAQEVARARDAVGQVVVGQRLVTDRLLMALVLNGHVLLEGLPGLAKTTMIKTIGQVTGLASSRVQFTPDLLPADLVGTQVYQPAEHRFEIKRGPVFTNLLLADEINRAPAKVQSALLECMAERQVTIGGETMRLAEPFLVLATQNPIEQEGTYSLPEAQLDRFLFKLKVGYGTVEDEMEVIRRAVNPPTTELPNALGAKEIFHLRNLTRKIHVAEQVRAYIVSLVFATRSPADRGLKDLSRYITWGASPRASIALEQAARANALFQARAYVTPQDIKDVAVDVLRHRILRSFEAEVDNFETDQIINRVLASVDVP